MIYEKWRKQATSFFGVLVAFIFLAQLLPVGAVQAQGETLPTLSISDASITEGDSGTQDMIFTISASHAYSQDIFITYYTQDGTATTADGDYVGRTAYNAAIVAGDTSTSVLVSINGDTKIEDDETFIVDLTDVINATIADGQGVGTILNDDFDCSIGLITTEAELASCIAEANANGAGLDTLTLGADITLSAALPTISSAITIEGANFYVDGASTYRVFEVTSTGNLTVNQITVQNGLASGSGGGGIRNEGTLTVTESTLSGNTANNGSGGGIFNAGTLTVTESTLTNNSALVGLFTYGGGIYNNAGGTLTVTHSTFSTNAADIGGGIFADTGGTLTVTESTFSGNSADVNGGGISNVGMAYLAGVILDTGPSGPNCLNSGTLTDNGYNLSDDASCGFSGTSANNVTLNLSALSVTTTPGQQVHTPQAGSVAISVIPNGTTINNNGVTLACNQTTTDQLGSNRPINGGDPCTSGAVEVPPLCPTPLAISDTDELANCINWANTNPDANTLGLDADITLSAVLPQITTEIALEGAGYTVDGANTYRVFEVTSTGNLTVNQITVQNGRSPFDGGGILNDSGTLTVTNSTFSGNFASNNGGAITNNIGGTLTVANSTVSGNTANSNGGGIYNASGTVTVTNSTFSNNSSPSNAGGILNFNGVLTVTNSTFSGNSAPAGGGILNTGTVHLAGVILDTGTSGPNCANSGTLNDNGYNLSDDASCGFSGTSADSATLNLEALTGTGPGQQVHTPADPSDAIGVMPYGAIVNNNGVTLACNGTTADQLGSTRPIIGGDNCTSGAVEVTQLCVLPATVTTAPELARCIVAANANGAGLDTITLGADINLSTALPQITTAITLEGAGYTVDGANSVRVFAVTSTGNLTINQITVQNGLANASNGGGIYNSGMLTVTGSTLSANSTTNEGGGIYNDFGTVTVTHSTISANSSQYGGGIFNNAGTLTVTHSTLSANSANFNGGGIENQYGTATVTHTTFSGNNADTRGGGISSAIGTVHLAGVILDTGTSGPNCSGVINDNGYNLSDDVSCGFSGTSANSATLNLGALTGTGTGQQVHTPAEPSDAIGAIPYGTTVNNNGVTLACNGTTTDQLGGTRPIASGDDCTSGAIEVEVTPLCVLPATVTTEAQLASCITAANANGAGLDTITLGADITLSAALPQITSEITIEGANFYVDGANSYRVFEVTGTGNMTVNQITVQNGLANASNGGGIFADTGGTLTVTNSTLSGNSADQGGGIYTDIGTVTVTNSTFSGNSATGFGGGIYNFANLAVTNSTFSGNSADRGGGIYNDSLVTMTNSTFSGNSADQGGSIYNLYGGVHLAGVILDTGTSGSNCENNFGTLTDNGYNLSDDASCGFSGTSANNATLNLGALSVTTTPGQQVHTPQAGSDAIGAIPNGTTVNNNGVTLACNGTTTDQLGSNHPIVSGSACTSGAVEAVPPPALSIDDVRMNEGDSGTQTYTFTITVNKAGGSNISVQVDTSDGTATTADNDYVALTAQTATITAGDLSTTVDVIVNGDILAEADETFFVNLSNPTNAVMSDAQGQGTITNDDIADSTPPVITSSLSGTLGDNGWYVSDVTVSFTCADEAGGSGIATDTVAGTTLTADGANQSVTNSGECADNAGNTAAPVTVSGINIDKTAPTAGASISPAANANGWHNTDVTVSFSGSDASSGIATCDPDVILSSEGTGFSASGTCTDKAGNVSATASASGINIDKTDPIVSVTGVVDGASYILGDVPAAGCDTEDALSGVDTAATLTLSGANPDGSGIITASCAGALDYAGNSSSASATYTVLTPEEAITNIVDDLEGLVDDGVLKKGQANGLIKPVQNAIRSLEKGKTAAACNQLADFIAEVNAKTPSPLDAATAAELIADAQDVQTAIGCS